MQSPAKIFGNFFDDRTITTFRLCNFAEDCLDRFRAKNSESEYTAIIAQLEAALTACRHELGDVDVALARQKGKTLNLDEIYEHFKDAMSDLEGAIAYKVGGYRTDAYLEFFPNGLNEYSKALKGKMPELLNRVSTATTRHNEQLGEELSTKLLGFKTAWEAARTSQQQQKGVLRDSRSSREENRHDLEVTLTYAIHYVGTKFPTDVMRCMDFFNFSMLEKIHHQEEEEETPGGN